MGSSDGEPGLDTRVPLTSCGRTSSAVENKLFFVNIGLNPDDHKAE
jgi:hypothetical protein